MLAFRIRWSPVAREGAERLFSEACYLMELNHSGEGLVVRTPAKLNLFLDVGKLREDGYHPIDSIFQAVSFYDELEFIPIPGDDIELVEEGISAGKKNIVYQAAEGLRQEVGGAFPSGVRIILRKSIPCGAGLGGGSSDAAATLIALRELFGLQVAPQRLLDLGAQLGSDVPFFFSGGTARCRGRGELITPLDDVFESAGTFHYVLVCPAIEVPTRDVYEAFDQLESNEDMTLTTDAGVDSILRSSIVEALADDELLFNRLETVACGLFAELAEIQGLLAAEGFRGFLMSGSGSTFFGLCDNADEAVSMRDSLKGTVPDGTRVLTAVNVPNWSAILES